MQTYPGQIYSDANLSDGADLSNANLSGQIYLMQIFPGQIYLMQIFPGHLGKE